jgi:pimeloyl-ACP methyl ester carboxylesterase
MRANLPSMKLAPLESGLPRRASRSGQRAPSRPAPLLPRHPSPRTPAAGSRPFAVALLALLAACAPAYVVAPVPAAPVETEVSTISGGVTLKGAWLEPSGRSASEPVVIIPGSGPTDRDGNSSMGVQASTYRLLAAALAARGIPSARTDKRGMFSSAAPGLDPNAVNVPLYALDAGAWTAAAKRRSGARCAWLLGHSEGALVALTAAQTAPDLCGPRPSLGSWPENRGRTTRAASRQPRQRSPARAGGSGAREAGGGRRS